MKISATIEASAPTRIDLAGGTVDLWPLYLFHPGAVTINAAVDLRVRVRIGPPAGFKRPPKRPAEGESLMWMPERRRWRRDYDLFAQALRHFPITQRLRIQFHYKAPKGAGLAGSSAMLVALCGALLKGAGLRMHRDRLLLLARDIETRLIRVPAGTQDYYPALWGGIQALWWMPGGVRRQPLAVEHSELERRILLAYSGTSRHSGVNNWEVFKRHLDGDRRVQSLFEKIVRAGQTMVQALEAGDFIAAGRAMAEEAKARTRLFPGITTPRIRALERITVRKGAVAVKVCGAGGGGCVVLFVDPDRRNLLKGMLSEQGFVLLPFKIDRKGLSFHGNRTEERRRP